MKIYQSPQDPRSYSFSVLENGLKVLCIHDPKARKSAAALDVHTGSLFDPPAYPGLAHFVEHCLFLGTKTDPSPHELDQFFEAHDGYLNAYTDADHTQYHFDIETPYFSEALERLADCFLSPLFDREWVLRERLSIEEEFQQERTQDALRINYFLYSYSLSSDHPLHRFRCGRLHTLSDTESDPIEMVVRRFFQRYYTADRMTLVLISPLSMDKLRKMLKTFEQLPQAKLTLLPPARPLVRIDEPLLMHWNLRSITQMRQLILSFFIPPSSTEYSHKAGDCIAYLLSREAPGSLCALLRAQGYIEALDIHYHPIIRTQDELLLVIDLTPQGLLHVPEIIHAFFEYVAYHENPQRLQTLYTFLYEADRRHFEHYERTSEMKVVSELATALHITPPTECLRAPYILNPLCPTEAILEKLSFCHPENMRRFLIAPDIETNAHESLYGIDYQRIEKSLSPPPASPIVFHEGETAEWIQRLRPHDFSQNAVVSPWDLLNNPTPKKMVSPYPRLSAWTLADPAFQSPRLISYLYFSHPNSSQDPLSRMYLHIWQLACQEILIPYHDVFHLVNVHYQCELGPLGLVLIVQSYADKSPEILSIISKALLEATLSEERFGAFKQRFLDHLHNHSYQWPYEALMDDIDTLLRLPSFSAAECLALGGHLNYSGFLDYIQRMREAFHCTLFLYGHIKKNTYEQIAQALPRAHTPDLSRQTPPPLNRTAIRLPAQQRFLWTLPSSLSSESAVCFYAQAHSHSLHMHACVLLLARLMQATFFHECRTIQQLGYTVFVQEWVVHRSYGLLLTIQSSQYSGFYLLQKIQTFLVKDYPIQMRYYSEKHIHELKTALISSILKPKSSAQEASTFYWSLILDQRSFRFPDKMAEALAAITKEDLEQAYHRLFLYTLTQRHIIGMTPDPSMLIHHSYFKPIDNIQYFKQNPSF